METGILLRRNENTPNNRRNVASLFCKGLRDALSRAVLTVIFTNAVSVYLQRSTAPDKKIPRKLPMTHISQTRGLRIAQNPLHPPVNHLHSIEKSEDTVSHFSLTLKMKRVKKHSFFDSF
jgi:hypothetical protein